MRDQLLDRYFQVGLDGAPGTRRDYISKANGHIRPVLGFSVNCLRVGWPLSHRRVALLDETGVLADCPARARPRPRGRPAVRRAVLAQRALSRRPRVRPRTPAQPL